MSTAKPCKMRRRPTPLTPEQQQLAAEAWGHVAAMAAEAERLERRLKVLRRMAKYLEELDQADSGEPTKEDD